MKVKRYELGDVYNLFQTIEIPILDVVVNMELKGVNVDLDYAKSISAIYHAKSDAIQVEVDKELEKLKPTIDAWRQTSEANNKPLNKAGTGYSKSKNEQLADPPDLGSPTQMAIILYDVLKAPVIDKKSPRGTGADILEELAKKFHICQLLVDKRGVDILINTFIDAIPTYVQKDGNVHARFNTVGTQTGRFSSNNPNLQNIPSHAKDIRMLFRPEKGYAILGADYSAQEPRSTASLSKDKAMLDAYDNGKDLYAVIAAACFHNHYEDNLEFHPVTGALQPDGKKRRSKAKTILLGITYGMGSKTLADRMDLPVEEAEQIIEDFYKGFPGVKKLTEDSQNMLRKYGYVTDMWGRRRHIPDAQLPEYDIKVTGGNNFEFNPMIGSVQHEDDATRVLIEKYRDKLSRAKWKKDKDAIIEQAKKEGLEIHNNGGFINRALRQCLNARIQGTAASMTKSAMIKIDKDPELNKLGCKLLITVHDEVLASAPIENAERASQRMSELMVEAAKEKCVCKFKCDPYVVYDGWYEDELIGNIRDQYNKDLKTMDSDEALNDVYESFPVFNKESVLKACKEEYEIGRDSLKYGPNYY